MSDIPVYTQLRWLTNGCIMFGALLAILFGLSFLLPNHTLHGPEYRNLKETATLKSLDIALKGFEIEYAKDLPRIYLVSESAGTVVEGDILAALMGEGSALNPRKIRFFDPRNAREGKNGVWKNESGNWQIADYWGNPIFMQYDADNDGKIVNPETPAEVVQAMHLFYTAGRDQNLATWEDNVASWRPVKKHWRWFWQ